MSDQTATDFVAQAAQSETPVPLPLRHDTILGVCQGVGEDFGFDPTWLRIIFGVALFFSPLGTIAAYVGLGALVSASRLLAPDEKPVAAIAQAPVQAVPAGTTEKAKASCRLPPDRSLKGLNFPD